MAIGPRMTLRAACAAALCALAVDAFAPGGRAFARSPALMSAPPAKGFEVKLDLGDREIKVNIPKTMAESELIIENYPLPFFIDIESVEGKGNIVTKDGSEQQNKGSERTGDRLRGFTYFTIAQGFQEGGGPVSMLSAFGGASVKYRKMLFDATQVPWEAALEKLMTNEPRRTDSVTMIFERPKKQAEDA